MNILGHVTLEHSHGPAVESYAWNPTFPVSLHGISTMVREHTHKLPCHSYQECERSPNSSKQQDPLEHGISLALGRIIYIWIIQQSLDTQNNLEKSIRISPLETHFRIPTCLMVIAGFHDFSSSSIDRQTVPEGYTFG